MRVFLGRDYGEGAEMSFAWVCAALIAAAYRSSCPSLQSRQRPGEKWENKISMFNVLV